MRSSGHFKRKEYNMRTIHKRLAAVDIKKIQVWISSAKFFDNDPEMAMPL